MSSPQHLGQSHEEKNHTGRKFFLNKYGMKPFMCSMYGLGQQMSLSYLFICIISTDTHIYIYLYIHIRTYIHVYIYCIYFCAIYVYIYSSKYTYSHLNFKSSLAHQEEVSEINTSEKDFP